MNEPKKYPLPLAMGRVFQSQLDQAEELARAAERLRGDVTEAINEHCRMMGLDPSLVQYDPRTQTLLVSAIDDNEDDDNATISQKTEGA